MLFISTDDRGTSMLIDVESGVVQRTYNSTPTTHPFGACFVQQLNVVMLSQRAPAIFSFGLDQVQPLQKSITPEKIVAITASPCDGWLFGGGESGCLYVWHTATGELVSIRKGHVREIVHIDCSSDGLHVASASADTTCRVYTLASVVSSTMSACKPCCTISSHTLALTSAAFFEGPFIATISLDKTCRITDYVHGVPQSVIRLEASPHSVALLASDDEMMIGFSTGDIVFVSPYASSLEKGTPKKPLTVEKIPARDDAHRGKVVFLGRVPNTNNVVSVSEDGVALLWSRRVVMKELFRGKAHLSACAVIAPKDASWEATKARGALPILRKFPNVQSEYHVMACGEPAPEARLKLTSSNGQDGSGLEEQRPLPSTTSVEGQSGRGAAQHRLDSRRALEQENLRLLAVANELLRKVSRTE